jgi:hypothetical protein
LSLEEVQQQITMEEAVEAVEQDILLLQKLPLDKHLQ